MQVGLQVFTQPWVIIFGLTSLVSFSDFIMIYTNGIGHNHGSQHYYYESFHEICGIKFLNKILSPLRSPNASFRKIRELLILSLKALVNIVVDRLKKN